MVLDYDRRPEASVDRKIQTLMESVQLALNDIAKAQGTADVAKDDAQTSVSLAETARAAANEASDAASAASTAAADAQRDATAAGTAASNAQTSANSAKTAADTALVNLAQIEKVTDVVSWITEHAYYVLTNDTSIVDGKVYYTVVGTEIVNPTDADVKTYYEYKQKTIITEDGALTFDYYELTSDTSVDPQKTYYHITGTPVSNPQKSALLFYYELNVNQNEAIGQYIMSHLALTDDGLYVMTDDSEWKVLIKSDGIYIIDSLGERVAAFQGQNIDLGMNTITSAITMCKKQCVINADMASDVMERGYTPLINLTEVGTSGGIDYDIDEANSTVTLNGTATSDQWFIIGRYNTETLKKYGTYTLTGCPAGGSTSTYYLDIRTNPDSEGNRMWIQDTGAGKTLKGNGALGYEARVVIKKGTRVNNLVFKDPLLDEEIDYGRIISLFYTQGLKDLDYTKRITTVGNKAYVSTWDISDAQGEVQDSGMDVETDTMEFSSSVKYNTLLLRRRLEIDSEGLRGIPITIHGSAFEGDNAMIRAESDSGVAVRFGVGTSGFNHGVYSEYDGKWLVYSDAGGSVFIDGINTSNLLQKSQIITDEFPIDNISIDGSATSGAKTVSVEKSGYTPLMIQVSLANASSSGKNVSGCNVYLQELNGNTARINIANRLTTAAKVKAIITVLYKAN